MNPQKRTPRKVRELSAPPRCEACDKEYIRLDKRQKYCSRACALALSRKRLAELKAQGKDPAHGGKAAEARRQSLAKRRAEGELLGRARQKANAERQAQATPVTTPRSEPPTQITPLNDTPPQGIPPLPWDPRASEKTGQRWGRELSQPGRVFPIGGPGTRIWVENDMLCIRGGVPEAWIQPIREGKNPKFEPVLRLARAVHGLSAIVLTDYGYTLTSDAWEWLYKQDVGLFAIALWGDPVLSLLPGKVGRRVALRRKQYTVKPLGIAKSIVAEKLKRCAAMLDRAGLTVPDAFANYQRDVDKARTSRELLLIEANAAWGYFAQLKTPLRFTTHPEAPPHWHTWQGSRVSQITGSNRKATHPVNALLNFGYSLLVARLERALTIAGLDPHAGFLHVEHEYRASLAWDAVELLRADVDAAVLAWVRSTRWHRRDFDTDEQGAVFLSEALARVAAQRLWLSESRVSETVDWMADLLR